MNDRPISRQATSSFVAMWLLSLVMCVASLSAEDLPRRGKTVESKGGVIVTVSEPATEAGLAVLDDGGNAVDAAIAVAFALAVTWPEAGNIGGGGFMLVHAPGNPSPVMIDYREQAPAAATVEMFAKGRNSQYPLVGVPGTVRGLQLAHQRFAKLTWRRLVTPAVELAERGFPISRALADSLNGVIAAQRQNVELLRVFGKENGQLAWQAGDRLVQPDLARILQSIADDGPDAFYRGRLAELLVDEMQRGGGLITTADLTAYRARERAPVHGTFREFDVYASSPPSSGGTALVEMLNMAETFPLRQQGRWSAATLHQMTECMRRAYLDRARYLGDPDFTQIPAKLVAKNYAAELATSILPTRATSSAELGADILTSQESPQTTHFSVIDREGMAVSNTYTLEDEFGSKIVVRGAGYLLNNEMGDFNPKTGVTNSQGQIGTAANLVAPRKRMLSSMTPVIVVRDGQVVLVTGSPGGRTIINTVFCVVLNVLEFDMPIREAVDAPRMHHQWMPDRLRWEPSLFAREGLIEQLREKGHHIDERPARQGDAHSIAILPDGRRIGAADLRRDGWAAGQ